MKMRSLLVLPLFCFSIASFGQGDTAAETARYNALATKVQSGETVLDWREFRLSAQLGDTGGTIDWHDADKQAQAAFNAGKFDEALKEALIIQKDNLANPAGHFDAYVAYKHLNKTTEMARERVILDALLKSITDSGDGKSAATAYFTVAPSEEYFYMGLVLGLRPKGQALVNQGGHAYDKMTGTDDSGKEVIVWFNTDTDMQKMSAALGGAKKK